MDKVKKNHNILYIWIILLIIICEASWTVNYSVSADEISNSTWQSIGKFLIYLLTGVLVSKYMMQKKYSRIKLTSIDVLYFWIILLGILTSIWSPDPKNSFAVAISMFCVFVFIRFIPLNISEYWKSIFWGLACVCLFSIIAYLIAPTQFSLLDGSGLIRVRGIIGHPNGLGKALAIFITIELLIKTSYTRTLKLCRAFKIILFISSVCLLTFTDSRSSIGFLLIVLIIMYIIYGSIIKRKNNQVIFFCLALIIFITITIIIIINIGYSLNDLLLGFSRSGNSDEILTLTGRTDVWRTALEVIKENPWGVGLRGGYILLPKYWYIMYGYGLWFPAHSHNMYLETALTLGILGLVLFLILIIEILYQNIRFLMNRKILSLEKSYVLISLACLFLIILVGITERSAMGNITIYHVIFLVIITTTSKLKLLNNG